MTLLWLGKDTASARPTQQSTQSHESTQTSVLVRQYHFCVQRPPPCRSGIMGSCSKNRYARGVKSKSACITCKSACPVINPQSKLTCASQDPKGQMRRRPPRLSPVQINRPRLRWIWDLGWRREILPQSTKRYRFEGRSSATSICLRVSYRHRGETLL